jgi:hypothetical protein
VDITGVPVVGADVFVATTYNGGMRELQKVAKTQSDSSGKYTFDHLPIGFNSFSTVILVARIAGRPIAIQRFQPKITQESSNISTADLVIPETGAALKIHVFKNKQPFSGATVQIFTKEGDGLYDSFYVGSAREPEAAELRRLLEPIASTGTDGTASFTLLRPALWLVIAGDTKDPERFPSVGMYNPGYDYGVAEGVPLSAGQTTEANLDLQKPIYKVAYRILDHNGAPHVTPSIGLSFTEGSNALGWSSSGPVDSSGYGAYELGEPGLWGFSTSFKYDPSSVKTRFEEPYDLANSFVAVSPLIQSYAPTTLHAVIKKPGAIHVILRDENGNPARGSISIKRIFGSVSQDSLSTNSQGECTFSSLASGSYELKATIKGREKEMSFSNLAFPPSKANLQAFHFLPQTVKMSSGEVAEVVFKPEQLGYISGRIILLPGANKKEYTVFLPRAIDGSSSSGGAFSMDTGTLMCGPLQAGKCKLNIFHIIEREPVIVGSAEVRVEPGKIASMVLLDTGKVTPAYSLAKTPLNGRILMPDGRTPAWGARVSVFIPEGYSARKGMTDALGRIEEGSVFGVFEQPPLKQPAGSPNKPVVAVLLPGECGAVIADYKPGQPINLTLPHPISLSGRVTVNGQRIDHSASVVEVCAGYQGLGKLNKFLSVQATVEPDGTFQLRGLTPGRYAIQASRDRIWLSKTQTIDVSENGKLAPIILDIPPIGGAVLFHFQDADGKPLIDAPVTFDPPAGPLADLDWPNEFRTDGVGDLRFDGFSAGAHTLTVAGETISFDAPNASSIREPHTINVRLHKKLTDKSRK